MTWRHDITTSYEWKIIYIPELSDLQNHGNKNIIKFLAHLQAEIGVSNLVTSWKDIMTSRHHKNEKFNDIHFLT